jgi:hypothetical protein
MRLTSLFFPSLSLLGLLVCAPARAAEPNTSECLAASEASIKAGNEHKLRQERQQLLVCAASSCPGEIRKECTRRVDEVNEAIPSLVFEAKDGGGNDLSDVKVTMDGEVLADHLDGSALSVDPGEHTFTFETPGQPAIEKQLVVREAEKQRHETIQFGVPSSGAVDHPPEATAGGGLPGQKIAALVVGGVGVVGLGVGGAFGVMAISKKHHAEDICPSTCTDDAGSQAWSDAKKVGNISTIAFIAGGVALAGGAVLWFTAPSQTEVGLGPGSIRLRRSF